MLIGCKGCQWGEMFDLFFFIVFQFIVDVDMYVIFGYEVFVCGLQGEGVFSVLLKVMEQNCYYFDQ